MTKVAQEKESSKYNKKSVSVIKSRPVYYINKFIMIDEDQNMDLNLMLAGIPVYRCSSISAAHPQTRLTVNNC